jgi:hypothetical protein
MSIPSANFLSCIATLCLLSTTPDNHLIEKIYTSCKTGKAARLNVQYLEIKR